MSAARQDQWLFYVAFALTLTLASPAAILNSLSGPRNVHSVDLGDVDLTETTPRDLSGQWLARYLQIGDPQPEDEDSWRLGYPDTDKTDIDELIDGQDKRAFSPWSGKRAFNPWSGKRAFNPWSGKRAFNPWSGKRSVDGMTEGTNKRAFNPWSGKRSLESWEGADEGLSDQLLGSADKRQFTPWGGKRGSPGI